MFYLNPSVELTGEILSKMMNKFFLNVQPKLVKYKKYYDGIQAIAAKTYADATKPCNHTTTNYCKNITDNYCGYIASPGYISYISPDDITPIMNILRYNDYQAEDNEFLLNALIYGTAAELMYIDSDSQTRFRLINPQSCFGIYDDGLTGDLLYFVRFYQESEWDNSDNYLLDVYNDYEVRHYRMTGKNGSISYIAAEPHYFNQCPANIFSLQDEKSIFDCILTLQDSYNELLTSEIDDYSAFCDAYLALVGVDADVDDIVKMKENRVLVLPTDGSASWLTKNASDAQVENILKRLHESIYRIAQCPDFSNESFNSGVSSGVAIRYKLCNMENQAGKITAQMKKALQRRIELICGLATMVIGEDLFRDVSIEFKRNIPEDYSTIAATLNAFSGLVSKKTLLGQIPFIQDVNAELEALNQEKEQQLNLYNFVSESTEE